jgi:hypothetical protein
MQTQEKGGRAKDLPKGRQPSKMLEEVLSNSGTSIGNKHSQ